MTEENMVDVEQEGQINLKPESENDDSEDSPTETNETDDAGASDQPDKKEDDPDKDKPFHEHPRWKQRETEWESRFNEQETRHQEDLKGIREEFGKARKDNSEQVKIPSWFGGTQEQWDAYRDDRDKELKSAEDRAYDRLKQEGSASDKAVKEATDYMQSEITFLESDKTLNPEGKKVDPNKLLKIVMDNDLVDSKGRWNYRAGFRMMKSSPAAPTAPKPGERKVIAGATNSESKGESKPAPYKTSADFKKNRPW
ncbi:MAG: hypothetical protein UY34_C0028G0013 [Parcubacteria group bacterium GW2011_GWA2_48_9]|nr:MAG: hypothetical protein UY34_C0028G0013 [Parcubacteria group bacterium GW2011_GWA2_48_9]